MAEFGEFFDFRDDFPDFCFTEAEDESSEPDVFVAVEFGIHPHHDVEETIDFSLHSDDSPGRFIDLGEHFQKGRFSRSIGAD